MAVPAIPPPPPPPPSPSYQPPPGAYGTPYLTAPVGPAPGLAYAGFWIRLLAYLIDAAILDIPLYGLLFGIFHGQLLSGDCGQNSSLGTDYGSYCTLTGFFYLGVLAITILHGVYFSVLWSRAGQSVGQMALGLWVVDARNGARISFAKAVTRFLGYIVSGVIFDLGYMWAGWDPRKQGWHDKIAGTFVVRRV